MKTIKTDGKIEILLINEDGFPSLGRSIRRQIEILEPKYKILSISHSSYHLYNNNNYWTAIIAYQEKNNG